jgi:REP element-mobilizing transposase RayT
MARPHRLVEPGAFYHVGSRGNSKQPIYWDRFDRIFFLQSLGRAARRYRWIVYAYCLMTNHYHLVLQVPDAGLSEGMCELNCGYSRRTNLRYGRSDHLFRNRFFDAHIETDGHLLEACRYVILNPVRAELCSRPEEWQWSSYRACAGLDFAPPCLATDEFLRLFARTPDRARATYRKFVADAPEEALRPRVPA